MSAYQHVNMSVSKFFAVRVCDVKQNVQTISACVLHWSQTVALQLSSKRAHFPPAKFFHKHSIFECGPGNTLSGHPNMSSAQFDWHFASVCAQRQQVTGMLQEEATTMQTVQLKLQETKVQGAGHICASET